MTHRIVSALAGLSALALVAAPVAAQRLITAPPPPIPAGITVDRVKVHSAALVGNLEGNSADRDVLVVLPPSYGKSKSKHYPVVYFLHGFALDGENFFNYLHVPEAVAHEAARGTEFIVVVPDTLTKMGGSMYSSSVTTGDFQQFIAKDVVAYVDAHYRTIAKREGRGLAGHSMGGYGTWTIGMKYPGPWSSIYAMSACCVSPRTETVESAQKLSSVPFDGVAKADFGTLAGLASTVAWSPAPDKPPYFADFPFKDGAVDKQVIAEWAANSPLAMVPQYVWALKSYKAIGADVGDKDTLLGDDTAIHNALTRFGIAHDWAVYPGTHVSAIAARFDTVVLPFFAKNLATK
ncbi:alpha/beta hydrolase [Sphingomonas sp. MMS24-J13]|uniref:alpha/beta hydrolase n=1 Tax=Sphingomonas sp. MMS24-J13 TaxID=3238686 RepID=UPI00384E67A1